MQYTMILFMRQNLAQRYKKNPTFANLSAILWDFFYILTSDS